MDLTDKQWSVVAPHIPKAPHRANRKGRPRQDNRIVLNGILWVLRTGAPWHDLPERYPSYQTCHRRFQEWNRLGVWPKVLRTLSRSLNFSEGSIDATFAPAKKGGSPSGRPSAVRGRKLQQLQTKLAIHALSQWLQQHPTKYRWWQGSFPIRLTGIYPQSSSETAPMTATRSMRRYGRTSTSS